MFFSYAGIAPTKKFGGPTTCTTKLKTTVVSLPPKVTIAKQQQNTKVQGGTVPLEKVDGQLYGTLAG